MKPAAAAMRVLVVDDQALFRSGLVRLLNDDPRIEVVGEAADGYDAIDKVAELQPAVVLMDLKMPGCDGVEATQRIVEQSPRTRVLVLSSMSVDSDVMAALRAGASGYVLKDASIESIVSSLLTVAAGETVISSSVAKSLVRLVSSASAALGAERGLTAREVEVLKLMASGLSNKQLAYRLRLSEKTIRNHVSSVYEKLGVFDRAQAALYAARIGLIEA